VNSPLKNLCVEVGKPVQFIVSAKDPNGDFIQQIATSGVFNIESVKRNSQKQIHCRILIISLQLDSLS